METTNSNFAMIQLFSRAIHHRRTFVYLFARLGVITMDQLPFVLLFLINYILLKFFESEYSNFI